MSQNPHRPRDGRGREVVSTSIVPSLSIETAGRAWLRERHYCNRLIGRYPVRSSDDFPEAQRRVWANLLHRVGVWSDLDLGRVLRVTPRPHPRAFIPAAHVCMRCRRTYAGRRDFDQHITGCRGEL